MMLGPDPTDPRTVQAEVDALKMQRALIEAFQHEQPPHPDIAAIAMAVCVMVATTATNTTIGPNTRAIIQATAQRSAIQVAWSAGWFKNETADVENLPSL